MAESDKIVNGVIDALDRAMNKSMPGMDIWISRKRDKEALIDLLEEVKRLRSITKPVPKTLGDISDLPEELLSELSAIKTDDVEDQIFTIVNSCEGKEANIDTILVELFRRFHGVHKRTYITNKLWRMINKSETLWNGPSGKGYYTTLEPKNAPKSGQVEGPIENFDLDDEIPF